MLSICEVSYFKAIYERSTFVSNCTEEKIPTVNLDNAEENLRKFLILLKDSDIQKFQRMYNYFIYYLYVQDGEITGREFQEQGWSVDRKEYFKKCCTYISGLIIAEQIS